MKSKEKCATCGTTENLSYHNIIPKKESSIKMIIAKIVYFITFKKVMLWGLIKGNAYEEGIWFCQSCHNRRLNETKN